jgi:methyl-accepting chemotaxis protein
MIRTYPKVYASDPYRWQQTLRDGDKDAGGTDRTVKFIGDQIVVEWADRLKAKLENDTSRVQSAQVIAKALNGKRMGKLHDVAQRVAQTRQRLSDEADKIAARLDQIDQKAPNAFANAHSILDQHNADIDAMEAELRQLSNLPLEP